jgi:hypothetical protein
MRGSSRQQYAVILPYFYYAAADARGSRISGRQPTYRLVRQGFTAV